jgi:thioredoxin reductase (NADPH)
MGDDDPVLLLATTDKMSRNVIGAELRRRYGGDYEVVVCADYAHARAVLEGLKRWGRQVALVIACFGPQDRDSSRCCSWRPSSARRQIATTSEWSRSR